VSLILQTEAALAEAVAALDAAQSEACAADALAAEADKRCDAAYDTVKRIRSALEALQGLGQVSVRADEPSELQAVTPHSEPAPAPKPKKQKTGLQCPSCGDVGTLNQYAGYKGSTKTVTVCSGCSAEFVS